MRRAAILASGPPAVLVVLAGRCCSSGHLMDIAQHPQPAEGEQSIAAPTLIKALPLPLRRFLGDTPHTEETVHALERRQMGTKAE